MVCKSCGAPFEDSSPVCPYCGWENAAVAEQQQQQQLQGIFARIANLLQLPQRTAERTTRFLKKAGRYILLVFAAALVLALAFSVLAPRFQLRKQQQNLQQLESYYTARDYDALYAMMDGLDDGYRAVYQKYDITAELYHSVLYLRQYAEETVSFVAGYPEGADLLDYDFDTLFSLLARCDELEAAGYICGEQQAAEDMRAEALGFAAELYLLTDAEIALGTAQAQKDTPDYTALRDLCVQRLTED